MDLFEQLNNYILEFGFRPNKKLGQHFLISEPIIHKILKLAELKSQDTVLEIGPGTGFISNEILKKSNLLAVELDTNLFELLNKRFSSNKNFTLVKGDFLRAEFPIKFNKVVSAPPYSISSEIIYKLFEFDLELAVLIMQKEFIEKLTAFPGFREYSAITVAVNYYFEPTNEGVVPPSSFFPRPNDFSAILRLVSKKRFGKVKDEKLFLEFLKEIFRYKNKNLSNVLNKTKNNFKKHLSEKKLEEFLQNNELCMEKVQLIEVEDFVKIFNQLF